jgi:hypothetical protein
MRIVHKNADQMRMAMDWYVVFIPRRLTGNQSLTEIYTPLNINSTPGRANDMVGRPHLRYYLSVLAVHLNIECSYPWIVWG